MQVENVIPWMISLVLLIFSILTYAKGRSDKKKAEDQEDTDKIDSIKESLLKVNIKLDQVCSTTTETRTDIKSMNKDIQSLDTRVVVVERDLKTAFKLIDDMKGAS